MSTKNCSNLSNRKWKNFYIHLKHHKYEDLSHTTITYLAKTFEYAILHMQMNSKTTTNYHCYYNTEILDINFNGRKCHAKLGIQR